MTHTDGGASTGRAPGRWDRRAAHAFLVDLAAVYEASGDLGLADRLLAEAVRRDEESGIAAQDLLDLLRQVCGLPPVLALIAVHVAGGAP